MLIQCTKKLLTELKIKPTPAIEGEALFSWHANILSVNRRKTLVLMNDSNRYVIVLHGLKAKDFKKIDEVILQAIRKMYQEENIKDEVIEAYLAQSNELTFTSTKNRTCVARLNRACENLNFMEDDINPNSIYQVVLSKFISRLLVGNGKNDYIHPNKELYRELQEWTNDQIFNSEAVILHVRLEMEDADIWRRIIVPKRMTFSDLHRTMQILFDWQDSHLHEFTIFETKPFDPKQKQARGDLKPIVQLVCHEEAMSYGSEIPLEMETGKRLSDYLPAEIMYTYDFGDDWRHRIVVENFIDDYYYNYPICTAGEGDAPPEDVGGEPGYEAFLEVIKDPTHPDHDHMESWGRSQGYEKLDLKMTNRRLENL